MTRMLFVLALLLLSVWFGVQWQSDPGYVFIAIHHWTLETTVVVALGGLIALFLIVHGFLLMLHWFIQIPTSFRNWKTLQRTSHAQKNTRQGLIEFSEGHWLQAKNHLITALPNTDTPLLNYLTAARAAQEMGDSSLRDHYLREAQQSMPEAKIAVELTQAQLQLANQQWEQALATLRHLQDLSPKHPYVLKLLMQLYQEINDWPQLIALLPTLTNLRVIPNTAFLELQQSAYTHALQDLIKQHQSHAVDEFIKQLPKQLIYDAHIVEHYARFLIETTDGTKAETLLRQTLQKKWSEPLIALYGQLSQHHPHSNQLDFAESLLKKNANSAALYLCLSRICRSNQLWGKAKSYLEASLSCTPNTTAYKELGLLLEQLGDSQGAFNAYRQGVLCCTCD